MIKQASSIELPVTHQQQPDGNKCGDCKHWVKNPIDPNNLKAERMGECRQGPPQTTVFPEGFATLSYPKLPPKWNACSKFKGQVEETKTLKPCHDCGCPRGGDGCKAA